MGLGHSPRIVTDGLVLCLDAANKRSYGGSGTTWTDLKGGNNGVLTNGPTFSSDNGGTLIFDGTDDYITLSSNIIESDFTVCFWMNLEIVVGSTYRSMIGAGGLSGNGYSLVFKGADSPESSTASILNLLDGSASVAYLSYPFSELKSNWKYISFLKQEVLGSNYISLYIDGDVYNSSISDGSLHIDAIGSLSASSATYPFDGKLACFSVYNRKLAVDEIRQNYLATKERYA